MNSSYVILLYCVGRDETLQVFSLTFDRFFCSCAGRENASLLYRGDTKRFPRRIITAYSWKPYTSRHPPPPFGSMSIMVSPRKGRKVQVGLTQGLETRRKGWSTSAWMAFACRKTRGRAKRDEFLACSDTSWDGVNITTNPFVINHNCER